MVPTSYIQLEDIICSMAQECHKFQKAPVLTYLEFRYIVTIICIICCGCACMYLYNIMCNISSLLATCKPIYTIIKKIKNLKRK